MNQSHIILFIRITQKQNGSSTNPLTVDSDEESDGNSALRSVEVHESGQGARRGPSNTSLQHFHDPTPVVDKGGANHWEFQCRFCAW